jgi:alkylhydroperoxidase/carboxymuconolactone decarboxylase family protein YurZ
MSLTQRQQQIKDEFIKVRGTWGEAWEAALRLDPEFVASYLKFSAVPWRKNHLDDKVKELIYIAVDANATHLYVKGLKLHIENAIGYGATPQEILEVMEIASVLGIHAVTSAAPILAELAGEHSQEAS